MVKRWQDPLSGLLDTRFCSYSNGKLASYGKLVLKAEKSITHKGGTAFVRGGGLPDTCKETQ